MSGGMTEELGKARREEFRDDRGTGKTATGWSLQNVKLSTNVENGSPRMHGVVTSTPPKNYSLATYVPFCV